MVSRAILSNRLVSAAYAVAVALLAVLFALAPSGQLIWQTCPTGCCGVSAGQPPGWVATESADSPSCCCAGERERKDSCSDVVEQPSPSLPHPNGDCPAPNCCDLHLPNGLPAKTAPKAGGAQDGESFALPSGTPLLSVSDRASGAWTPSRLAMCRSGGPPLYVLNCVNIC